MKTLIIEDEQTSILILEKLLTPYGTCHVAKDGNSAIHMFNRATDGGEPYQLVTIDKNIPEPTGDQVLKQIRKIEDVNRISPDKKAKIVMVTAANTPEAVIKSFEELCDGYVVKPIDKNNFLNTLKSLGIDKIAGVVIEVE